MSDLRPPAQRPQLRRALLAGGVLAVAVLLVVGTALITSAHDRPRAPRPSASGAAAESARPSSSATPGPKVTVSSPPVVVAGPTATALPSSRLVQCPDPTVTVHSAEELQAALRKARPGTRIAVADGTYGGTFVATASGTDASPIWLCGGRGAVLDGGGTSGGYGLHLDHARHWRVVGLTIRNAQKGVVADGTTGTVLQDLLVEQIGDEGIHLRSASTGNAVLRNTVQDTGQRKPKFGEGIYIGSAESNWQKYSGGGPDRSDHNLIQGNTVSRTTAECVDIKEGTTGGALVGNTFDGAALTEADSWVDVKGNDWLVADNTGHHAGKDGFQTHQILTGWGSGNTFRSNTAADRGSGVDFYVHKPDETHNRVLCDNHGPAGAAATSNTACVH